MKSRLTPQQRQTLDMLAAGWRVTDMAKELDVAASTMQGRVARLMDRYIATTHAQLVARAFRAGDLA